MILYCAKTIKDIQNADLLIKNGYEIDEENPDETIQEGIGLASLEIEGYTLDKEFKSPRPDEKIYSVFTDRCNGCKYAYRLWKQWWKL